MFSLRWSLGLWLFLLVSGVAVAMYDDEDYVDENDDLLQMLLDHVILHQTLHTQVTMVHTKTAEVPKKCYKFCAKKKENKEEYAFDCIEESLKMKEDKKREKVRAFCFKCRQKCIKAKLSIYI
uniref:uncharacterized protein LOC120327105 n=1 Tax=Styela clava TaxID=7725 RepID=UPI00193A8444|nr:uncharacterized protein LOC120327105 [Styela clava]